MNCIILKGRLAKDIELKYVNGQTAVANITIAVQRQDKKADFINCVCWNKQAEFVNKYFKKGQEILINGELQTDTWKDENGKVKNSIKVNVQQIEFCGSKTNDNQFSDVLINNTTNYTTEDKNSLDLPF